MAVFEQNADCRDIGRSADRCEVPAQRCARKQTEVKKIRLDIHSGGNTLNDRQHRRDIRNIVNERGDRNGTPDDDRIQQEQIVSANVCDPAGDIIDDADIPDTGNDDRE